MADLADIFDFANNSHFEVRYLHILVERY
jgi:hypothetical protein